MNTCVGPHGAQSRLQQSPPHIGSPASVKPASVFEHTTPSTALHWAPVWGGCPQTPNVLPCAMVQMPPQQSVACWQASPACPQYEGCAQMPFSQKVDQHSAPAVHALPSDLQTGLSAAHFPLVHLPPQH